MRSIEAMRVIDPQVDAAFRCGDIWVSTGIPNAVVLDVTTGVSDWHLCRGAAAATLAREGYIVVEV